MAHPRAVSSDRVRRLLSALRLAQGVELQAEIGQAREFSQGTVSRELVRNAGRRGYGFQQAQRSAQARQQQILHQSRKLTGRVRRAIARKQWAERWSPEQLSSWLRAERGLSFNHKWVDPRPLPQYRDFTAIHLVTVATVERLLDRRLRKLLGFQTSNEVFHALVKWS